MCLAADCAAAADEFDYPALREKLVAGTLEEAGVTDPRVLRAMRATPRHEFIPAGYRRYAYSDVALPIGEGQTISPPLVVASMTQAIDPQPTDRVLEIGTGSGYQAAVLSPLAAEVDTIEIVERLGKRAERTLARLGYKNVFVRIGDGYAGWPEKAPFDKIIVTCSPEDVPRPLVEQLREGGKMIIPVGERYQQNLALITKRQGKLVRENLQATFFVPMTGAAEASRRVKPDPLRPAIANGDFEQAIDRTGLPVGWYYAQRARLVRGEEAPEGSTYLHLASDEPGQGCQVLQGFGVDGRKISAINLRLQVRGEDLAAGPTAEAVPGLVLVFYDERRAAIDDEQLGPWTGSFAWRQELARMPVPLAAREAVVRIGLQGGVGRLDVDDVQVEAAGKGEGGRKK